MYDRYIECVHWVIHRHTWIWIVAKRNWRGPMPESRLRRPLVLPAASFGNERIGCPSIVASRSSSSPMSPFHMQLLGVHAHCNSESMSGNS